MNTAPSIATIQQIEANGKIIPGPQSEYTSPEGPVLATIFDTADGTVIHWNPKAHNDYRCFVTLAMGGKTYLQDGGRLLANPEAVGGWDKKSKLVLSQIKKAVN